MLAAYIPYIDAPELTLIENAPLIGPFTLKLFGPLVAAGLILGRYRCLAYARRKDLDQGLYSHYLLWMLLAGFVISHWVSAIFYFPHEVQKNPWVLLQIWNGLSSVGGFFGAFVGAMIYLRIYCARQPVGAQPVLIFSDTSVFGLLIGWCFGRAGCSFVHDHPGRVVPEGTFMAVGPWPDGSWRYDLGLIELLFAIVLMLWVYCGARWEKWPPGRLTGLVLTVYAPLRFVLDSLRSEEAVRGVIPIPDARYLGLTPAQWFTIVFLLVGVWLLRLRRPTAADLAYAKDSERLRQAAEATPAQKA
jgi:phosphatidylglycerol---prolipoprotein diacylglyceryl transferase